MSRLHCCGRNRPARGFRLLDIRHRGGPRSHTFRARCSVRPTTASATLTTAPTVSATAVAGARATSSARIASISAVTSVSPVATRTTSHTVRTITSTCRSLSTIARRNIPVDLAIAIALDTVTGRALAASRRLHFGGTTEAGELLLLQGDGRTRSATIASTAIATVTAVEAATLTGCSASAGRTTSTLTTTPTWRGGGLRRQSCPDRFVLIG